MREIPNTNGAYLIAQDGSVWSMHFRRWLKPRKHNGYLVVNIKVGGKKSRYHFIHKLLAIAWIENPHGYTNVNHKDGNKANNDFANLEWCSKSHDVQHSWDTGLRTFTNKTRLAAQRTGARLSSAWAKLNMNAAREIRWMRLDGYLQEEIAKSFSVSRSSIQQILERRAYREIVG